MANFESGVSSYIRTKATVTVGFPVDSRGVASVCCNFCRYYSRYNRQCKLTDDILAFPERYVGDNCPLELDEEVSEIV